MQPLNTQPADYAIVTSYSLDWKDTLAPITDEMKYAYAKKWGYHFFADCSDLYWPAGARTPAPGQPTKLLGFIKLDMLLDFLPRYKGVVWIDADCLISNFEIRLEQFFARMEQKDIGVSYDHNGFHSTVIFARNTKIARDYLWACNNTGRNFYCGDAWHEMTALRHFWQDPPYTNIVHLFSAKETCPIYKPAYVKIGLPIDIGTDYAWEPGDWTCHLSALGDDERVRLAQRFAQTGGFE